MNQKSPLILSYHSNRDDGHEQTRYQPRTRSSQVQRQPFSIPSSFNSPYLLG